MVKRIIVLMILLVPVLQSVVVSSSLSERETPWWNSDWCFRQMINIPIDTSEGYAKFQPVDLKIVFDNLCWAKNEMEHSVRVVFQQGEKTKELESQIYDLEYERENYITSCNLVFLIPEEADGNEKYFVYYSDTSKPAPGYENHVDVDESYYRYEPIPGLFFESSYYSITEDGFIVYAVTQEGEDFAEKISQQVAKLKEGAKYLMPNMNDQLVSFDFIYWWLKDGEWKYLSSSEHLVSKQVFVDGNLMVKFGIVSESSDGFLRSKVVYKYYYSPGDDKGIYVNVTHEVIRYPLPSGDEIDVAFATFHCGGVKSSRIKELNFGEIPPFLHFYSEEGYVVSHDIDQYPESKNWEMIIGKKDDYDIGNQSWLSVDYGESGKAHGIIFDSNNILESGENERDGIELQLYESNSINLPGLDARFAYLYIMRNAFESDEPADEELPSNYVVSFNAEFLSTENGGYKRIEDQAHIYKQLISSQPGDNNIINGEESMEKYDLTVYTYLSSSLIAKYLSSKLFLKYPYILVKLYQNSTLIGSCRSSRIALTGEYTVDWRNISLFRKARFLGLNSGVYLVKIYLENLLLKEKEFIGYKIVDLQENTSIKVLCKPEGRIILSFYDQDNNSLRNVECYLIKDDVVISSSVSNSEGICSIGVPTGGYSDKYVLRSVYKGFLVDEKEVILRKIYNVFPLRKKIIFDVYDFEITFRDSNSRTPDFDVDMSLISDEMKFPVILKPDIVDMGFFGFRNIYPSNYTLMIKYDDVEVFETYNINKDVSINIDLYDFVLVVKDTWNLSSDVDLDVSLISNEDSKSLVLSGEYLSNGTYSFINVYPGEYVVRITYKDDVLEENVKIPADYGETVVVFPVVFNLTLNVYDSHGDVLGAADVFLTRDGKVTHGSTLDDGKVSFEIPPGRYKIRINYSDYGVVAGRDVDVLNDKTLSIVTVKKPFLPLVVLLSGVVFLIVSSFISFRKKNIFLFLGCLAIVLAVLSIVSPWWSLNGCSTVDDENISSSTNLYMVPLKMVTITSYNGIVSGELDTLNDSFVFVISVLFILIVFGCALIFSNVFLRYYHMERLEFVSYLLGLFVFVVVLFVFVYAMSEFANVIVGGLSGGGVIEVLIPGEGVYRTLSCSWGFSTGFYLMMVSMVVLFFSGFVYRKTRKI